MLVNRACSQGVNDSTPAPSVTAAVKFDANILDMDYAYIIDLGHSLRHADGDTGWVAIPETTYTATMPDGTIPFTTILGPGEGRLLKIVEASQITLNGSINTNYIYQGQIDISGSANVSAGGNFKISGPALFEVAHDSTIAINIYGAMNAIGTEPDSIWFIPSGGSFSSGAWKGLWFKDDSFGELRYCSIKYGVTGVEMEDSSVVNINHSSINGNSYSGIDSYKGFLTVDSSTIESNVYYGIYSYKATATINACNIYDHKYGIYCWYYVAGLDSTIVTYCDIENPSISESQYGIFTGLDPTRIYKCTIRDFSQGGILLNGSDALILNCTFTKAGGNGIYAYNWSFPYIRQCLIDSVDVSVRTYVKSKPDLGTTSDYGNCTLTGRSYYIYHDNYATVPDTMFAQYNWYGTWHQKPINSIGAPPLVLFNIILGVLLLLQIQSWNPNLKSHLCSV